MGLTDRERFIQALGWVYENSPWVAEEAFASAPFPDPLDALHHAMAAQVEGAQPSEQLALLRADPDLGTRARSADASESEQSGAGLLGWTGEEFERLTRLNSAYRDKFGFPFLFAVKGSNKHRILQALEQRLGASPADASVVSLWSQV